MESQSILQKLKTAPFIYTEANRIREYLKSLASEDRQVILNELRSEKGKNENQPIQKVLHELLNEF